MCLHAGLDCRRPVPAAEPVPTRPPSSLPLCSCPHSFSAHLPLQLLGISSDFLSSLLGDYLRGTLSDTRQQVARAIQLRDIMTSLGPGECG